MVRTKMFAHWVMLTLAVIGCGVAASELAYTAAGAAMTTFSYAIGR